MAPAYGMEYGSSRSGNIMGLGSGSVTNYHTIQIAKHEEERMMASNERLRFPPIPSHPRRASSDTSGKPKSSEQTKNAHFNKPQSHHHNE